MNIRYKFYVELPKFFQRTIKFSFDYLLRNIYTMTFTYYDIYHVDYVEDKL